MTPEARARELERREKLQRKRAMSRMTKFK
jgi:hypothetical protein